MARMSSRKIGRTNGGKAARIMEDAYLCEPYCVVLSGAAMILNFTDGERTYSLILDGAKEVDAVRSLLTAALPAAA
jgi:hypothetical protein